MFDGGGAGGAGGAPVAAPGGTGPAMSPAPMLGNTAQGMAGVKTAVEALQKALPSLPMGSDIQKTVLKALSSITPHLDDMGDSGIKPDHDAMVQQLAALARQQQQGGPNPMAAMMPGGAGGGDGAAPPPPGA